MYDCIPYLKVVAMESLSADSVAFCDNKAELAKELTSLFVERGLLEDGDSFSDDLFVAETIGENSSDETVDKIFDALLEFSEKKGIALLANYCFSGIAPDGLTYVFHPEFFSKGERFLDDLEDCDWNPSYVEVLVKDESWLLNLDLADDDVADEYKNNGSDFWEQFSEEELREKGLLLLKDVFDDICGNFIEYVAEREEMDGISDGVKEGVKAAFCF